MTSISDTEVVNAPGGLVELGYEEFTHSGAVTATSGSPLVLHNLLTVVCDGSPIELECYLAGARPDFTTNNANLVIQLYEDGSLINSQFALIVTGAAGDDHMPHTVRIRKTPSAGIHTYEVRAYVNTGSGYISSNILGRPHSYLRASKILQASQLLVTQSNAPLVTSLPANPIVGQEVIYIADATNGVYWRLYYDGIGSYPWKFVGGPPILNRVFANGESTTSSSYAALTTAGPTLTLPLAGDYDVNISAITASTAAAHYSGISSYDVGATGASDTWGAHFGVNYGPGFGSHSNKTYRHAGLAASTLLVGKYRAPQSVQVYFNERVLTATPVRVAS